MDWLVVETFPYHHIILKYNTLACTHVCIYFLMSAIGVTKTQITVSRVTFRATLQGEPGYTVMTTAKFNSFN